MIESVIFYHNGNVNPLSARTGAMKLTYEWLHATCFISGNLQAATYVKMSVHSFNRSDILHPVLQYAFIISMTKFAEAIY